MVIVNGSHPLMPDQSRSLGSAEVTVEGLGTPHNLIQEALRSPAQFIRGSAWFHYVHKGCWTKILTQTLRKSRKLCAQLPLHRLYKIIGRCNWHPL